MPQRGRPSSRVTGRHFAIAGPLPSSDLGVQPFLQLPKNAYMQCVSCGFNHAVKGTTIERSVIGELRPVVFWDSAHGGTES